MKHGQKKEKEKEGRTKDKIVEQRRKQVKRAEHNMADTGRGRRKQKRKGQRERTGHARVGRTF